MNMATPSPWIEDGNTGRLYVEWKNEYGETKRRYDEEQGTNRQPSHILSSYGTPQSKAYNYAEDPFTHSTRENQLLYDQERHKGPRDVPEARESSQAPISAGTSWGEVHPRSPSTSAPTFKYERVSERVPMQEAVDYYRDIGKTSTTAYALRTSCARKRYIAGTGGDFEPVDDIYKVRNYDWKRFFRPGRVFSTLWTDPFAGTPNDSEDGQFMSDVSNVIYKERTHCEIRRFVVVRSAGKRCTCLPVITYSSRESRERGINLSEHGLIYSSGERPLGVKGIEKLPLRVKLTKGAEHLYNPSYVNYGAVYTVEVNVKVRGDGQLDSESRNNLRAYYNQVHLTPFADEPIVADTVPVLSEQSQMVATDADIKTVLGVPESPKQALDSVIGYDGPSFERNDQEGKDRGRLKERWLNMMEWMNARDESSRSRSSSLFSTRSMATSLSSTTSSSLGDHNKGRERLISFLTQNQEVDELCRRAFQTVEFAEFAEFLRLFLIAFAKELKSESSLSSISAPMRIMRQAARVIARSSRTVADTISHQLQSQQELGRDLARASLDEDSHTKREEDADDEDDSRESESESDDDGTGGEFSAVEESLMGSGAFRALKENLKLLANPDPVQRALLAAWPLNLARISWLQIGYQIEWDLLLFVRKCFPAGQKLGDVMTLTGGVLDAQALSCWEYLTMAWPSHETLLSNLLEAIESLIDGNSQASFHRGEYDLQLRSDEATSLSNNYGSQVSLNVFATHDIHAVILSALSWLCAAIRYSPFAGIAHSSISITGIWKRKRSLFELNLIALEELPPGKTCWHVLFPHAVIAKGFPIKGRRQGHGLEISFSNMFLMSRSMSFIEYDGGLLGQGLRSLLVPVKLLEDDNALQWHYAIKQKHVRSEGRIASVLRRHDIKEWYKVRRPSTLIERRCFLGWAEEVSIKIGTEGYPEGAVRGSGIEKRLSRFEHKSHNVTLGSNGLGYARESGIQLYMPTAVPSIVSFDPGKDISDYLIDEQDADVLIYDTRSKTATFLPHACVALLLVRKIVARRQYELYDGLRPSSIGFTPTRHNGGQAAIKVLLESLSLKVRKAFARKSAPLHDLSVTVRQALKIIETARCAMEVAEIELESANTSPPSGLLQGIDFMDLVSMPSRLVIRPAEIGQAWTYLGGHHSTVLFCRDLGEAIECSRPENQCRDWLHVPRGRNYLVMTGLTIVHLLEQFEDDDGNSRFGQHLEWIFLDDPMHIHRPGLGGVAHVQSVELVGSARGQKGICERLSKFKDSGFIFANAKDVPDICCQKPVGSIALPSLHEESDDDGLIQQLSADAPDNSSSTSLETEGSSVPGQLATTDSMSSNETQGQQDPSQAGPLPNSTTCQTASPSIPSFVPPVTAVEVEVEVIECKADMKNDRRKPRWLPGSSLQSLDTGTKDEKHHTTIRNRIYQIGKGKGKVI